MHVYHLALFTIPFKPNKLQLSKTNKVCQDRVQTRERFPVKQSIGRGNLHPAGKQCIASACCRVHDTDKPPGPDNESSPSFTVMPRLQSIHFKSCIQLTPSTIVGRSGIFHFVCSSVRQVLHSCLFLPPLWQLLTSALRSVQSTAKLPGLSHANPVR